MCSYEDIEDIGYCMKPYDKEACGDCYAATEGDCPGMRNMVKKVEDERDAG
jgi:hypothetical protein